MGKRNRGKRQRELDRALHGQVVAPRPVLRFKGEAFIVADEVGLMPLLRFAHMARQGVDSADLQGLTAIYDLLWSVIAEVKVDDNGPTEWERFQDHASATRATGDDLMQVVSDAIELITAHPTERRADSSGTPQTTKASSADDSSSRVIRRLEKEGRPSIALMVRHRLEHDSRATG